MCWGGHGVPHTHIVLHAIETDNLDIHPEGVFQDFHGSLDRCDGIDDGISAIEERHRGVIEQDTFGCYGHVFPRCPMLHSDRYARVGIGSNHLEDVSVFIDIRHCAFCEVKDNGFGRRGYCPTHVEPIEVVVCGKALYIGGFFAVQILFECQCSAQHLDYLASHSEGDTERTFLHGISAWGQVGCYRFDGETFGAAIQEIHAMFAPTIVNLHVVYRNGDGVFDGDGLCQSESIDDSVFAQHRQVSHQIRIGCVCQDIRLDIPDVDGFAIYHDLNLLHIELIVRVLACPFCGVDDRLD